MEDYLQWKTTSNERRLLLKDDLQLKTTSNARRSPREEDLKVLKVQYLSNHQSDLSQILNLSSGDKTETKNA